MKPHVILIFLALIAVVVVVGQVENIFLASVANGWRFAAAVALGLGTDGDVPNGEGRTPLMIAVSRNDRHMVRLLMRYGCDPDSRDPNGRTPLMYAAVRGYDDIAELLVDQDADVGLKDGEWRTAAWYAKKKGHEELAEFLLETQYGSQPEVAADEVLSFGNYGRRTSSSSSSTGSYGSRSYESSRSNGDDGFRYRREDAAWHAYGGRTPRRNSRARSDPAFWAHTDQGNDVRIRRPSVRRSGC